MLAYLNGKYLPHAEAAIAPWDYGFMMGVTVTEFLRTFGGRLHLLDEHMERLSDGLAIVGIDNVSIEEIKTTAIKLAEANYANIDPASDLAVCISVTPGAASYGAPTAIELGSEPTIWIFAKELSYSSFADQFETGVKLSTVPIREIPVESVPKELKNRSRMHYYLAEREAKSRNPDSRALLLDKCGNIAEATTAGVCLVKENVLVAPKSTTVLNSMTFGFLSRLAIENSIPVERRDISQGELKAADEVIWFSTSMCCLPVTQIDEQQIPGPGPICTALIEAWSKAVKVDVVAQAKRFV